MTWDGLGMSPEEIQESLAEDVILERNVANVLRAQKRDLIAALKHLLAKPRCSACRKAVQAVLERIEKEG
jgi:hypothetical protein